MTNARDRSRAAGDSLIIAGCGAFFSRAASSIQNEILRDRARELKNRSKREREPISTCWRCCAHAKKTILEKFDSRFLRARASYVYIERERIFSFSSICHFSRERYSDARDIRI